MHLLPAPKKFQRRQGIFRLTPQSRLFLPPALERPESLAARRLQERLEFVLGHSPSLDRPGRVDHLPQAGDILLAIAETAPQERKRQDGYTLEITPERVTLTGAAPAGLYFGLQTLRQIVNLAEGQEGLPCLLIEDEPDFEVRGVYHDVTRGKVPKLSTLKELVDILSYYKVNQFQLYIEHTFMFRFDPEIAQNPDGMTAEEVLELQEFCRDRRIELVPSLQSFGHMGGILSIPRYRHLADVEMKKGWREMTWLERMRGATIDVSSEEAQKFLERLWDEYVALHDAPLINACADETYDLGKGKTKPIADEIGVGRLYLRHIQFLSDLARRYGKTLMFWGDIVRKHPEIVPLIPKDTILMDWGYEADFPYEGARAFAEQGLAFYVCPGTSGWNGLINNLENADLNIRRWAEAGKRFGAIGLLNTDWGDQGHYNPLAASLHGFVLGAAMSWNEGNPDPEAFDRAWGYHLFGVEDGAAARALRGMSVQGSTWVFFFAPFGQKDEEFYPAHVVPDAEAERLVEAGRQAALTFQRYEREGRGKSWVTRELRLGSEMIALLGEKMLLKRELAANGDAPNPALAYRLRAFAHEVEGRRDEYAELWRFQNKESEISEIVRAIDGVIDEARSRARTLSGQPVS